MNTARRLPLFAVALSISVVVVPRPGPAQTAAATCCTPITATLTKTMLKVKVATLTVDVDSATAARVQSVIGDAQSVSNSLSDSIAGAYMAATSADATTEFTHSVTASQFLGGQKDSFGQMVKAGLLTADEAATIEQDMEKQFAFLSDGGINNGDKLMLTLRGDSVTTRFVTAAGVQRAEFSAVGKARRMAFVGEYFGSHSDFRKGLLQSALESAIAARGK